MFAMTGKLLRITTFTTSGTWQKKDDVGSILVKVVGGGGNGGTGTSPGNGRGGSGGGYAEKLISGGDLLNNEPITVGGAGATSSFGGHCSATGGGANGGNPGVGVNGSVNLTGERGKDRRTTGISPVWTGGHGGSSPFMSGGGEGAASGAAGTPNSGGGGGGGSTIGGAGSSGIVIIYEFAK